jgi:hypothetical protein
VESQVSILAFEKYFKEDIEEDKHFKGEIH